MLNNQVGTNRSGGGGGGAAVRLSLLGDAASAVMTAEELAALQLDPPSDAMPELQQLRGLDQVQLRGCLQSVVDCRLPVGWLPHRPEARACLAGCRSCGLTRLGRKPPGPSASADLAVWLSASVQALVGASQGGMLGVLGRHLHVPAGLPCLSHPSCDPNPSVQSLF